MRRRAEGQPWGTGAHALVLVAIVLPLYLLTMVTAEQINVDAEPAALPAWHLVQFGTVDLTGFDAGGNPFVAPTEDGKLMSNRPIALSLLAVPAYLVTDDPVFTPNPSTVTAALLTMASVLVLLFVLRRCLPAPWALGGALVFALGTASWPISAGQLWPHGPGQLFAALTLLALSNRRAAAAGWAAAAGVLVRPVTAVVPLVFGIAAAIDRRWRDAVLLVIPAVIALGAVVAYNDWAFGEPSISGGYASHFRDNVTDQSPLGWANNVLLMALSPKNGLLVWSPVVAVALLGLRRSWSTTPAWARQGAIAGLVYILVHLRLNRASGGLPIDYRYPLEALTLAAPALVLAARSLVSGGEWPRRALVLGVGASLMLQGIVAVTYECEVVIENELALCSVL